MQPEREKLVEGSDEWIEPFGLKRYLESFGEEIDIETARLLLEEGDDDMVFEDGMIVKVKDIERKAFDEEGEK